MCFVFPSLVFPVRGHCLSAVVFCVLAWVWPSLMAQLSFLQLVLHSAHSAYLPLISSSTCSTSTLAFQPLIGRLLFHDCGRYLSAHVVLKPPCVFCVLNCWVSLCFRIITLSSVCPPSRHSLPVTLPHPLHSNQPHLPSFSHHLTIKHICRSKPALCPALGSSLKLS